MKLEKLRKLLAELDIDGLVITSKPLIYII